MEPRAYSSFNYFSCTDAESGSFVAVTSYLNGISISLLIALVVILPL